MKNEVFLVKEHTTFIIVNRSMTTKKILPLHIQQERVAHIKNSMF